MFYVFFFELGKEEYADIKKQQNETSCQGSDDSSSGRYPRGIGLLRPMFDPNRTDIVMATANPNIEHTISHNIGIYVWGFYQVQFAKPSRNELNLNHQNLRSGVLRVLKGSFSEKIRLFLTRLSDT
jgi:hypothetical protein